MSLIGLLALSPTLNSSICYFFELSRGQLNSGHYGPIVIGQLRPARSDPQRCRDWKGIEPLPLPPGAFIANPVKLAMVQPAKRNGELVADGFAKFEVMGIRGAPSADETTLGSHKSQMIAIAHRFADDCSFRRDGLGGLSS